MLGLVPSVLNYNVLPIISNIGSIKIANIYHNVFGMTRIGHCMALSLFPVFQYEASFPQFLADINTERTGTKEHTTKRH